VFTISAKGAYGIYAMLELAKRYRTGPVQIKDIAEDQGIPQHYLEQLLVNLRKAGFVKSFRGTNGGYSLARDPSEISVKEIFTSLEGPVEILRETVPRGNLDFFWKDLEARIMELLTMNLDTLLMKREQYRNSFVYVI